MISAINRAIIPAAGLGLRLRPYTADLPKGLIHVGGRPLLARTLEQLSFCGIQEVICVTGHCAATLERHLLESTPRPKLRFVHNPRFSETNSLVSLALTTSWWQGGVVIVDSDVVFTTDLLCRLLASRENALVIDRGRPLKMIDVGVELRSGRIRQVGKTLPASSISGEFFGLSRWGSCGARVLSEELDRALTAGETNAWYQSAITAAASRSHLTVVDATSDEWAEVDYASDVAVADALVASE